MNMCSASLGQSVERKLTSVFSYSFPKIGLVKNFATNDAERAICVNDKKTTEIWNHFVERKMSSSENSTVYGFKLRTGDELLHRFSLIHITYFSWETRVYCSYAEVYFWGRSTHNGTVCNCVAQFPMKTHSYKEKKNVNITSKICEYDRRFRNWDINC